MRSRLCLGLIGLVSLAVAFDSPAQVQASIQKEMNGYAASMKKKDAAGVEKFILANFAPDFKDTDTKGVSRNRTQTIQSMKDNIRSLQTVKSISLKVGNVKVMGTKATTSETFMLDAVLGNPANPKQTATLKVDSAWNSNYEKRNGKWICTSSKATKEKVYVNGKPMN